jgi:predicted membrane channel-forming protein YqfA (hemolysin III family)
MHKIYRSRAGAVDLVTRDGSQNELQTVLLIVDYSFILQTISSSTLALYIYSSDPVIRIVVWILRGWILLGVAVNTIARTPRFRRGCTGSPTMEPVGNFTRIG